MRATSSSCPRGGSAIALVIGLVAAACGAPAPGAVGANARRAAPGSEAAELDRLVADVCARELVLLGEDASHGAGRTLAVKGELVRRLIDECGFSVVAIEAGVYDFLDLEHAIAAGTATREQLADAIGGLWSTAKQAEPWIAALFDRAKAGRVTVVGLDGQIGATARYAQRELPGALAAALDGDRRTACEAELRRYTTWQYDDQAPYDDAVRARITGCLAEVEAALGRRPATGGTDELAAMTRSLRAAFTAQAPAPDGFNARDEAMFRALRWHLGRLPPGARTIVWCATIHAAKDLRPLAGQGATTIQDVGAIVPLGSYIHAALGDRAATIGFSAYAGSFGRPRRPPIPLPDAPPGSLEHAAFAAPGGDLRYLDRAALIGLGTVPGRMLNGAFASAPWGTVIDGVVVLRAEHPPDFVRAATPQRATAAAPHPAAR